MLFRAASTDTKSKERKRERNGLWVAKYARQSAGGNVSASDEDDVSAGDKPAEDSGSTSVVTSACRLANAVSKSYSHVGHGSVPRGARGTLGGNVVGVDTKADSCANVDLVTERKGGSEATSTDGRVAACART